MIKLLIIFLLLPMFGIGQKIHLKRDSLGNLLIGYAVNNGDTILYNDVQPDSLELMPEFIFSYPDPENMDTASSKPLINKDSKPFFIDTMWQCDRYADTTTKEDFYDHWFNYMPDLYDDFDYYLESDLIVFVKPKN